MDTYITQQGDTWDFIAYKLFGKMGRELLTSILIDNNQQFISTVIFPAGCVLHIPVINVPAAKSLPPWMS